MCRASLYCDLTAIGLGQTICTCLTIPVESSLLAALRTSNPPVTAAGFVSAGISPYHRGLSPATLVAERGEGSLARL